MKKIFFLLPILALLAACATTGFNATPKDLATKGIVIGKITSNYPSIVGTTGNIKLNNKYYAGAVSDGGHLKLVLPPGSYTLEEFVTVTGSYRRTFPMKTKFTIKTGEVTNLGIVIFYAKFKGDRFLTFYINNPDDMAYYLRKKHSDIYASLKKKTFNTGSVSYVKASKINNFRRLMRSSTSIIGKNYFAGSLGALATFSLDKNKKIKNIKWVNTGTLNDIRNCKTIRSRFYCLINSPKQGLKLYIGENGKFSTIKPPVNDPQANIQLVGQSEVMLITNYMEIYTSLDKGKSWSKDSRYRRTNSVSTIFGMDLNSRREYKIKYGIKGFYLVSNDEDNPTILYRNYKSAKYQEIVPPKGAASLSNITETSRGLYLGPEFTIFSNSTLYFKPKASNQWIKNEIPATDCSGLDILNLNKDIIAARCTAKTLISSTQGRTWREALRSELKKFHK